MSETTAPPLRSGLSPRWKLALGGLLAAALVAGGAVAVVGGPTVYRQSNGVVAIDGAHLVPLYYGQRLTLQQVQQLNKDHRAMVSVNTVEVACHGVSLYFDTSTEAERYGKDFRARLGALRARQQADGTLAGDPCAGWKAPLPTFTHAGG